jgi:hypothetical protein
MIEALRKVVRRMFANTADMPALRAMFEVGVGAWRSLTCIPFRREATQNAAMEPTLAITASESAKRGSSHRETRHDSGV